MPGWFPRLVMLFCCRARVEAPGLRLREAWQVSDSLDLWPVGNFRPANP